MTPKGRSMMGIVVPKQLGGHTLSARALKAQLTFKKKNIMHIFLQEKRCIYYLQSIAGCNVRLHTLPPVPCPYWLSVGELEDVSMNKVCTDYCTCVTLISTISKWTRHLCWQSLTKFKGDGKKEGPLHAVRGCGELRGHRCFAKFSLHRCKVDLATTSRFLL